MYDAATARFRKGPAHGAITSQARPMTNRIAIVIVTVLLILLAADLHFETGATLFLSRKFVELLEWIAFWR